VGHYHYIRCGDRKIFQAANLSKWKTVNFAIQTLWKTRFIFWCCVHYIQIFDMNFSKHLNLSITLIWWMLRTNLLNLWTVTKYKLC
jgi:hypothetical protein